MAEERETKTEQTGGRRSNFVAASIGFLAGAVAGAVTALLYAPQSGVETRKKIGEKVTDVQTKASDVASRTREAIEEARDKVGGAYESTKEKTTRMFEQARDKMSKKKPDEEE